MSHPPTIATASPSELPPSGGEIKTWGDRRTGRVGLVCRLADGRELWAGMLTPQEALRLAGDLLNAENDARGTKEGGRC